jgi:cellulose synthase/poly-beta-1,6-N-acetylglucosamine synthase-like glycosyltransferase
VEILFWLALTALVWTYVLFPATMLLRGLLAPAPRYEPLRPGAEPTVTVVLAVRDEARSLEARIANLLAQDYPADRLDLVVACNGCTDDSVAIAGAVAARECRVRLVVSAADEGKAGAVNAGVAAAKGELIVFADARQRFAPDAVRRLAETLADPTVGAVSGRLVIGEADDAAGRGIGLYWRFETALRLAQSRAGSVIGATGAIYAIRRGLFVPVPANLILDDVFVPMMIVLRRHRVALRPDALAVDAAAAGPGAEYRRKLRTMTGNLQLVRAVPQLLSPVHNQLFVRFVSHKLLRVLSPLAVVVTVVGGLLSTAVVPTSIASVLLLVLLLGAVGLVTSSRVLAVPVAFVVVQAAAAAALLRPTRDAASVWSSVRPGAPTVVGGTKLR